MLSPSQMLCAALAAGCVWSSSLAEAHTLRRPRSYAHHHPHPVLEPQVQSPRLMVRLGLDAGSTRQGAVGSLLFGVEGRYWGAATRLTALSLFAVDGSAGRDHLQVAEAHVTLSPVAGERGRLRLEGGVAAVRAPGVTLVGPSVGLSFERCLVGALDLEGRVRWVPLPLSQWDGQLGLAVHLGVVTLRAGWRGLVVDTADFAKSRSARGTLSGPFAGLGLNL